MDREARPRGAAFWLASGAIAWAIAFTAWVLTASVYGPGGETILEANEELTVRVAVFAPLAISGLVWWTLHVACRDGSRTARRWGVGAACVLLLFALLTGFTIGMFVLPGAIALTVAAALTPVGPPAALTARARSR